MQVILGTLGPWQVVLIIAVVLFMFGGKKIPELMKGLANGIKDFKDIMSGKEEENKDEKNKQ